MMQSALTSEICHSSYLYHENDVFFNYIYGMFLIKIESKDNIISQGMKIKLFSKKDAKWFAFFMSCMFCQKSLRISKSQNWLIELIADESFLMFVHMFFETKEGGNQFIAMLLLYSVLLFFFMFED